MVSIAQSKLIKSLQLKKYRKKYNLFPAEGGKLIKELSANPEQVEKILFCPGFEPEYLIGNGVEMEEVSEKEMRSLSNLKTPPGIMGIFRIPVVEEQSILSGEPGSPFVMLDSLRDPGNMGTIIRICDWYSVKLILCSEDSVDRYNSKVVQSAMGSTFRVDVIYTDLVGFAKKKKVELFEATMDGENIHSMKFPKGPFGVIIGNESSGVDPELSELCTGKMAIPRFGGAESLNAAIATGIILDNIRKSMP